MRDCMGCPTGCDRVTDANLVERIGHIGHAMGPASAAIATVATLLRSRADMACRCVAFAVHCGCIGMARDWLVTDHCGADPNDQIGRDNSPSCAEIFDNLGLTGRQPMADFWGQFCRLANGA